MLMSELSPSARLLTQCLTLSGKSCTVWWPWAGMTSCGALWCILGEWLLFFICWCLLCLHAGDDQRGAGGTEGLVLWSGTTFLTQELKHRYHRPLFLLICKDSSQTAHRALWWNWYTHWVGSCLWNVLCYLFSPHCVCRHTASWHTRFSKPRPWDCSSTLRSWTSTILM